MLFPTLHAPKCHRLLLLIPFEAFLSPESLPLLTVDSDSVSVTLCSLVSALCTRGKCQSLTDVREADGDQRVIIKMCSKVGPG